MSDRAAPPNSSIVSVVIPSRGGADRLPVLLDALTKQDFADEWEVVLVLDGDIDNSAAVAAQYAGHLPLRVVTKSSSQGVSAALNDGYDAALGSIVIRCDDDLTPRGDFVSRHVRWHSDRPSGVPPLGVIALTRDVFSGGHYADSYGRSANERALSAAYARPADQRWMHWAACNSVPKNAYQSVGGFDRGMTYREDSELGWRLAKSGVEMVIDPELEIEHRGAAQTAASRVPRAFVSGASIRAFEKRHGSDSSSARPSLWGHLVALTSRRLHGIDDAEVLGTRIDWLLPWMPQAVRGKAIALGVEAAGEAGRARGTAPWHRGHSQSR